MNHTTVYTMQSHDFGLLPAQVQLLRQHVQGLSRIVVAQGPFGQDPAFSAGNRMLPASAADDLGVELLTVASNVGGLSFGPRVPAIINQLKEHACSSRERYAIVLHGDVVPIQTTDARALLLDHDMAAHGTLQAKGLRIRPIWTAYDTESAAVQEMRLDHRALRGEGECKLWQSSPITPQNASKIPQLAAFKDLPNLPDCQFEWCEPLLHLRRWTRYKGREERLHVKIAALAAALQLPLAYDDRSVEITDKLPLFRPKMRGPMTLTPFKSQKSSKTKASQVWPTLARWVQAGTPERTDQEVDEIMQHCCDPCDKKTKEGTCDGCSCDIQGNEPVLTQLLSMHDADNPLRNKARIAMEHCPLWLW